MDITIPTWQEFYEGRMRLIVYKVPPDQTVRVILQYLHEEVDQERAKEEKYPGIRRVESRGYL